MSSNWLIDDGIMAWFDGPEWDEVAEKSFEKAADQVQETAQRNAPWADRSGDARAGLTANVINDNGEIVLTLFHTVDYGLWLEVIQNGHFAIILPTLESEAPKIFQDATYEVSKARVGDN